MTDQSSADEQRVVLNVGSGVQRANGLHPCFTPSNWRQVRFDIDERVRPDVVGSVTDMQAMFADASFDAIWSSHNIEHLYDHEVPVALREYRRVLKPAGFALITCPDLERVARLLIEQGPDFKAYDAPIGPITVLDMMFGHGASIAAGSTFMAHKTGFTRDRLGTLCLAADFTEVRVGAGDAIDLWALLLMSECKPAEMERLTQGTNLHFLFAS